MTRKKVLFFLRIIIGITLVILIIWLVKPQEILKAFIDAEWRFVAIGLLLMPLNIFIQERKWNYLVKLSHPNVKYIESLGSMLGGYALGIVTPGRIGEYGRALFLKGVPPWKIVGLTVIDKFYNLGCTIAIGLPALLTLPWALNFASGYVKVSGAVALVLLNLFLLYLSLDPRPVKALIYSLQMMFPKGGKIAQVAGGLDRFGFIEARRTLLLTVSHYFVFLVQYYFLILGFSKIEFLSSVRASAAVLFAKSALPIAIADLGIDQLASMQLFGDFGVINVAAVNASLLLFSANVLIPAMLGLPFIFKMNLWAKENGHNV